jgi:hypothetical protein
MSLRSVALLSEAGGKTLFQASSMEISNRPFAQGGSLKSAKNTKERQEEENQREETSL